MKLPWIIPGLRAAVLVMACLVPTVVAQDRDADLRYFIVDYPTGSGSVSSGLADDPKTELDWTHGEVRTITPSPFDLPGDGVAASQSDPPIVLCCGTKDPGRPMETGLIAQMSIQLGAPHSVQVDSQVSLPGVDAWCMSWSEQLPVIFVLDKNSRQVWMAPWAGPGQPLPPPPQWTIAFGAQEVPTLAERFVDFTPFGDQLRISTRNMQGYHVRFVNGVLQFTPFIFGVPAVQTPTWDVEDHRRVTAQGSMRLRAMGPGGALNWDLRYVLDTLAPPVLSGVHPGGANVEEIACPELLFHVPGPRYLLAGSDRIPATITALVQYGQPIAGTSLSLPDDIDVPAELLHVGVQKLFGIQARVNFAPPLTANTELVGFLLVDAREAEAEPVVDPVLPLPSGGLTLSGPSILPFSITVAAGADHALVRVPVDVPPNDLLENVVLFFQMVLADPAGGLALSSVAGTAILPAWASPTATPAASSSGVSSARSPSKEEWLRTMMGSARSARRGPAVRAVREMLRQDPESGAPSDTDRERLRELFGRLRR
ncbi:MAG: hypothetical protein AB7I19_01175 [Planctomycetota bacterium]